MTVGSRIERLCAHMANDGFGQMAAACGAEVALRRIIDAVTAGTASADLEAQLDAVDSAFAAHGVDNLTTGTRAYRSFPGIGGHPSFRAHVCPAADRCTRLAPIGRDSAPPSCALTGRPLNEIEISA